MLVPPAGTGSGARGSTGVQTDSEQASTSGAHMSAGQMCIWGGGRAQSPYSPSSCLAETVDPACVCKLCAARAVHEPLQIMAMLPAW